MRHSFKIIIFFSLIVSLLSCKAKLAEPTVAPKSENPTVLEKAKQVELTPATVDEFLDWASGSDLSERETVRNEIAKASNDKEVLNKLIDEFEKVSSEDLGYSLVVLSIIGELKNPNALPFLEEVVNQELPPLEKEIHGTLYKRDIVEMFASKAIEGVAYMNTPESDKVVLRTSAQHPSNSVREAAIDAFLFNKGDTEAAKEQLRGVLKNHDLKFLERARFIRGSDKDEFDLKLTTFYRMNPGETPQPPKSTSRKWKPANDSVDTYQNLPEPPKRLQR